MIYNNGKIIPVHGDSQPLAVWDGRHFIASASKVSENGTSLVVDSEYKTPCVKKVNGNTEKVFDGNNYVYSLQGSSEVVKSENLLNPTRTTFINNCSISNGVVTQTTADTRGTADLKIQRFRNGTFVGYIKNTGTITSTGVYNYSFVKDFDQIQIGFDGSARDTTIRFDISELENGKTYNISVNVTNITQGSFSFKDIMLNKGSTALAYEPYFTPFIKNAGLRNEINPSILSLGTNNNFYGLQITKNSNGNYVLNGTTTSEIAFYIFRTSLSSNVVNLTLEKGTYSSYFSISSKLISSYYVFSGNRLFNATQSNIVLNDTTNIHGLRIQVASGVTFNNEEVKVTIAKCNELNTSLDYGKYHFLASNGTLISRDYPARLGDVIRTDGVDKIAVESEEIVDGELVQHLFSTPQTIINPSQTLPDNLTFDVASTKEEVAMHHIESVEKVVNESENIFDQPNGEIYRSGGYGTLTNENGVISHTGVIYASTTYPVIPVNLPAGTYSIFIKSNISYTAYFQKDGSDYSKNKTASEEGVMVTYAFPNGFSQIMLVKQWASGTPINGKIWLTIVKGSQAPSHFIPHFNSTSEIKVDGGNLLNIQDKANTTTNGITYSIKDGVITINGTATTGFEIMLPIENVAIFSGMHYAIFNDTTAKLECNLSTGSGNNTVQVKLDTINNKVAVSSSATIKYIRLWVSNGGVFSDIKVKPMLVQGSTAPTEFYPFGKTKQITLNKVGTAKDYITWEKGKNLVDLPIREFSQIGVTLVVKDGAIKINGTTTRYGEFELPLLKPIKKGTYTIKLFKQGGINSWGYIKFINASGTLVKEFNYQIYGVYDLILTDDVAKIVITVSESLTFTDFVMTPMLIKGSTPPSSFEPYYDKALLHKEIGEVDLGSLVWGDYGVNRIGTAAIINKVKKGTMNICCSVYETADEYQVYFNTKNNIIAITSAGDIVVYSSVFVGNPTAFKQAMSGIKLYYELATPTDTPLDIDSPLTAPNIETTLTADGGVIEAEWWEAR